MVAVFAGKYIIDAATASDFQVERSSVEQTEDASSSSSGKNEAPAQPETIFVHVSGSVEAPGLVEVPAGSRVADAVESAGGFADDAVCDSVNLARILVDGEQVYVAAVGDNGNPFGEAGGAVQVSAQSQVPTGQVNLNTATQEALESLPGIGPSTASKIIADREQNGPFASVDELTRVSGIGDKKLASLVGLVCV
jgi:competence protein ComEA